MSIDADKLADLSPETRDLVRKVETAMPSQSTDEFTRIRETLLNVQVCTSLTDEEASERANLMPSGTRFGWTLSENPDLAPVPCMERPETHRHLIFEC